MTSEKLSKDASEIEGYFERRDTRMSPGWRPEPGATMDGEVIGLRTGSSEYGDYPIVVYKVNAMYNAGGVKLKDHAPTVSVHVFHMVLRERLAELKTDIGSRQIISYLGTTPSNTRKDKDGKPVEYHTYDAENFGESGAAKEEGFSFLTD